MKSDTIERDLVSPEPTLQFGQPAKFCFKSYGVNIRLESSQQSLLNEAERVTRKSLIGRIQPSNDEPPAYVFRIEHDHKGVYSLYRNGEEFSSGPSRRGLFKFFDSLVRVAVARDAVDHVFMHAGVVGWKGRAIVIPGDSFHGKSTLVAELVRNGAIYYSDEFAILDSDGLVHPFERDLAMRTDDGEYTRYELTVESLGGVAGKTSIPVGMVLVTKYEPQCVWNPKLLTPGNGVLQMIPFTISLSHRPEFSIGVLKKIAGRAIIALSPRGSAVEFAKILLEFVDKNLD